MRFALVILAAGVLASCAADKPRFAVTPSARVVYHSTAWGLFAICDKGNEIYLSELGPVAVIPKGCLVSGVP